MAPKENESTLFSSIMKEMTNVEEHTQNEVSKTDINNNNNNNNDNNIDQKSDESFWQQTTELMEQMEQEMQSMSEGKDVKFLEREDSDEQVKLNFELVGLTSEEIKISMTESNFLEIEYLQQNNENEEGPSFIWAYPLEQGLKVAEMKHTFEDQKLVVIVPKDPNFKPEEENVTNEEYSEEADPNQGWICPFWPFATTPDSEDDQVQIAKPIEAKY
jgi:HSP20 family molecular chaperone IbpA